MKKQLCVAFDLDDTLYKERDFVASGRKAVAQAFSAVAGKPADELTAIMEKADNAFDALLAITELKGVAIADILEVYRFHKPELTLPEESREAIDSLDNMGAYIAVITDGRSLTQWNKIKSLGVDKLVGRERVIVSEDIGADKKTPQPFEEIMQRCPAERYIYVGDNPVKDFYQARRLGWTTVMLRDSDGVNVHSQNLADFAAAYHPDFIIDNIKDLTNTIIPCLQH